MFRSLPRGTRRRGDVGTKIRHYAFGLGCSLPHTVHADARNEPRTVSTCACVNPHQAGKAQGYLRHVLLRKLQGIVLRLLFDLFELFPHQEFQPEFQCVLACPTEIFTCLDSRNGLGKAYKRTLHRDIDRGRCSNSALETDGSKCRPNS